MKKSRVLTIIDCFVSSKRVEENLRKSLEIFKSEGHEILLVSNTRIDTEILKLVDFHLYDSRNQLFQKKYPGVSDVDFWTDNENFTVHNIKSGLQKHGLSVLINLFNSLKLAKSLGYTHFQRFETDDHFGPISLSWIKLVPELLELNLKRGLFYTNPENYPPDASFHYFFCEIDLFLRCVPNISTEDDYEDYLVEIGGNRDFRIVEVFLYDYIQKPELHSEILIRDGKSQMNLDFPDTVWNTESSSSNLSEKYRGAITGIYKAYRHGIEQSFLLLYSTNYSDNDRIREIRIKCHDESVIEVQQQLYGVGSWFYHEIPLNIKSIEVLENGELLYIENFDEVKSYIEFK